MFVRIIITVAGFAILGGFIPFLARPVSMGSPPTVQDARVHHPVTTSSTTAQADFDRGLTSLYAFSRRAARRAFLDAASADPRLAMAWWGTAMSFGSNINVVQDAAGERAAYGAIRRALALSAHASPSERAYIKALATRFTDASKPDYDALTAAYHSAMRTLAQNYPQDLDAATLYAESAMDLRPWDLYANDGTPRPGTQEIIVTLESVLRRNPDHIGANHFYIHATEASMKPERALPSARRLAVLNFEPSAAHLTHMPAHTFARTGYFDDAVRSNMAATRHDRMYLGSEGRGDHEASMYYDHNLTFLAYAGEMEGNFAVANGTVARLRAEGAQVPAMFVLLRFHRWGDILALTVPQSDASEPLRLMAWHFARGMAFAAGRSLTQANRERNAMNTAGRTLRVPALAGWYNGSDALLRIADAVLGAKIASQRGDARSQVALLGAAVRAQDELIYIEPPDWWYPVRESLGAALLVQGRARESVQVFRDDLARNPRNPRSLFGIAKAYAAAGEAVNAQYAQQQYNNAWKNADVELTLQDF